MSLGSSIIAAILGYIVLLIVGINLTGIVIDGLVESKLRYHETEENISEPKSILLTFIFSFITLGYLYALYSFCNIGIAISALLLIFSRLPAQILESKFGHKVNLQKKRPIDIICTILGFLALPLLWYSLYFLKSRLHF